MALTKSLKKITIPYHWFFEKLGQSKVLTKVDLKGAYNLICIKEDNEFKTMFHTRYDHFEYNVMRFGLTNPPSIFQTWGLTYLENS